MQNELKILIESASKDITRYHLCGIYFDHESRVAISTDGYRMAISSKVYSYFGSSAKNIGEKHLFCPKNLKDEKLFSLGESKFVTWQNYVPKRFKFNFNLCIPQWLSLLAGKDKKIKRDYIGIFPYSKAVSIGYKQPIDDSKTGFEIDEGIYFNPAFLGTIASFEKMICRMNGRNEPTLFESGDFKYVLMPIRTVT